MARIIVTVCQDPLGVKPKGGRSERKQVCQTNRATDVLSNPKASLKSATDALKKDQKMGNIIRVKYKVNFQKLQAKANISTSMQAG